MRISIKSLRKVIKEEVSRALSESAYALPFKTYEEYVTAMKARSTRFIVLSPEEFAVLGSPGECESCGGPGEKMVDPYLAEMNPLHELVCLCDDCAERSSADV